MTNDDPLGREMLLFVERLVEGVDLVRCGPGRAAATSRVHPGGTVNEDAAMVVPVDEGSAVLAVADGMGGASAGERAAQLAVTTLADAVGNAAGSELRLRTALLDGVEAANRRILELAVGAATTLAVVELAEGAMRPYHVGDSLILLVGGRGKLKWKNVAHSPVGYGVESGFLDEREALTHDERHLVSNMLGSPEMRIEIGPPIPLAPRDTVLLASDGLADNLHLEEITALLCQRDLVEAVDALAVGARTRMLGDREATAPGKPDDLTIVAFRLGGGKAVRS